MLIEKSTLTKRLNPRFGDNITQWQIYNFDNFEKAGHFWPRTPNWVKDLQHSTRARKMLQWIGFKIWLHVDFKTQLCVRPFLNAPSLSAHWISHFQNPPRCFLSLSGKTKVPRHEQKEHRLLLPVLPSKPDAVEHHRTLSHFIFKAVCVSIFHTPPVLTDASIQPSRNYEKRTLEDLLASLHFNDDKSMMF